MIEVVGLVKELGDRRVLDGLDLLAPVGQITGLLGPNGAGKTTTMRVLSTLLRPDGGSVRIAGHDVVDDADGVRRSIGLVTEEPGLFERLTPREHLALTAELHAVERSTRDRSIAAIASHLGLVDVLDERVGTLSKGNRQKVSLARALVHRPPVLLLDEPTANLDVVASAGLHELLRDRDLLGETTVLLSSHVVEEVEQLADHVVGIVDGRTVASGSKEELVAQLAAPDFRSAVVALLGGAVLGPRPSEP